MVTYAQKLLLTDPSNYTNLQVGGGYINDNFSAIFDGVSIDSVSYNWTFTGNLALSAGNIIVALGGLVLTDGNVNQSNASNNNTYINSNTHASFSTNNIDIRATRASNSAYSFIKCKSSGTADVEFDLQGSGNAFADGSFTGGGADRGECLRWFDDNPNNEDRMGMSVVFFSGRIYPANHADVAALEPTGIISATADSIGNASGLRWHSKYVVDDFGRKEFETYSQIEWVEVVENADDINHSYQMDMIPDGLIAPTDAITTSVDENGDQLMRQKLNSSYDPTLTYAPRLERPEWDVMGMTGLVRMLKGQRTAPNWRKGDDVSPTVEEWLVK